MAKNFQENAFQNSAFQQEVSATTAFQENAFQNNTFQVVALSIQAVQTLSGSGNLVSLLKYRKRKIIQKRKVIIAGKAVCDQLPQEIYAEGRLSLTGYANSEQAKQKINISGEAMEYGDDEILMLLLAA
ncbi:MAG: hypothetical protein AABX75_02680 [Nanoarchaeota archaeon]